MFVSSGLNNVVTVMNGTDYFLDKAGIKDYMVFTQNGDGGVKEVLDNSENVEDYCVENCYWATNRNVMINNKKLIAKNNTLLIQSLEEEGIHFFLSDNSILTNVKQGEVYLTAGVWDTNNLQIGEYISPTDQNLNLSDKERRLNNWLMDLGW